MSVWSDEKVTPQTLAGRFKAADIRITNWMSRHGITLLRISLGIVFLWFGVLKFFPSLSPAESLAGQTISTLTFGLVSPQVSQPVLAAWETAIGLGLITGRFMRVTLLLMAVQMAGTITPLVLFPAQTWQVFPVSPTLEGQYIIKNLVLLSAAIVIGATVRGGAVIADPEAAREAMEKQDEEEQQLPV
jgi:uncharacterized membrane protein YphA (DoxX/SURF4 family)